jgi:hypothetical protein
MSLDFLRDCTFIGPALPEPFVRFELEGELAKAGLLPNATGAEARQFQDSWIVYRRKLRDLVRGGSIRVRNHVIELLIERLGYARLENAPEVETREGREDGGDLLVSADGNARLRVWCTDFDEDLEAPFQRGAAYRYSRARIAQRVLLACGECLGLLTNGTELRILISDPARPDSQIVINIDPAWKDKRSFEAPDSYRLLLALASPKGVPAIPDLVEKARLQQTRVTKELRRQAREAVEAFLQEVLDRPANQVKLGELNQRPQLARELWREALIVVYRLLFMLKLEATDDPARSFSFASTSLWRNTFSPSVALPRYVRSLLDQGAPTGSLLENAVRGLFRMFVEGLDCTELHVRPLGGTLFGEKVTPLLSNLDWGERGVALLLDRLLWTAPQRGTGRERVHYGSLDVEDLGRVYEALLELEPGIATEPMCRLRRAKLEVVVPLAQGEKYRPIEAVPTADADLDEDAEEETEEKEAEEPSRGCKTKVEWIEEIQPGRFYLRVGLGRKATGSYYTPHSFVRFLVQETLGPLVTERSPKDDPKPAEILKLKVLDPAMGSGHFLVEACRFMGIRLYEAARLCDERLSQFEKTATAAQNEELKNQAEAQAADYRQRLDAFVPPDAELLAYLPSRSPEASESGLSQKRAEAICRRLVAIHCLYGVDKNPLAVELAKVSLWIESHSEGLPLTFLDHRLVLGDSITGPFFHHLLTYPGTKRPVEDLYTQRLPEKFAAALTEAIALVRDIESTLGATIGDVEVKQSMRLKLEVALAPFKVVAAAWAGGVMLGPDGCDDDAYKWLLSIVAHTGRLPADLSSQPRLPDMIARGLGTDSVPADSAAIVALLNTEEVISAFPYDLAFPEVFFRAADVEARSGFDVVLGNPPWDRIEVDAQAYFSELDPTLLDAGLEQREERIRLLLLDEQLRFDWESFAAKVERDNNAAGALYSYQKVEVDGRQTLGRPDFYRLFAERAVTIIARSGRVGWLMSSSFHANEGATGVRRLYLQQMELHYCYSFENRKKLFEIDSRAKFAAIVASRPGPTARFGCAFYLHDDEWLFKEDRSAQEVCFTPEIVSLTGGKYGVFCEVRSNLDLSIVVASCRTKVAEWGRYLTKLGIETAFGVELHRNPTFNHLFEERLVTADRYLRCEQEGWGRLAIHSGKTMHHYTDHWDAECDKYVLPADAFSTRHWRRSVPHYRFAFRMKARSTDERTMIATLLTPGFVCEQTLAVETRPGDRPTINALACVAFANTYAFDFQVRQRVTSSLSNYSLAPIPVPALQGPFLIHAALRLCCNHAGYMPLWREQLGDAWRELGPQYAWPALAADYERWEIRAAADAIVAAAYGLDRDQYQHILASFTHTSFRNAPEFCLARFDELKAIGLEAFTRKYDPYWDIPLNENPPQPVIDISLPSTEPEAQGTLALTAGEAPAPARQAHARSSSIGRNGVDPVEYEQAKQFLSERRRIASSELQSAFGFDAARARALLKQLVEDGVAVVEGHGRATHYVANSSTGGTHVHTAGRPD